MELTSFKEWLLINGSSQATAKTYCDKLGSFFRKYESFNQESINTFFASKLDKWTGNSFNIYINAIKHYAKFLKIEIEIPKYHKSEKRVKAYITDNEIEDILDKIPLIFSNSHKAQAVIQLMFSTGLRPKEIVRIKREDFNFDKKTLNIKNTKTHRDKVVILSNDLCKLLPTVFNQEAEESNAFNITHAYLTYIFQRINQMLNLKVKLTPYSLRHAFAHDMLEKGLDLNSLKVQMGHQNIQTTLGYLDVLETEAQDKVRKILNKKKRR